MYTRSSLHKPENKLFDTMAPHTSLTASVLYLLIIGCVGAPSPVGIPYYVDPPDNISKYTVPVS